MAALIWNWRSVTRIITEANDGLLSDGYDEHASLLALESAVLRQSWMITITLGANVSPPLGLRSTVFILHPYRSSSETLSYGGAHALSGNAEPYIIPGRSYLLSL